MAMDALEKCSFNKRPVKLILQSDEENGSRNSNKSTVKYMAEKAKACIAFLNTEPYTKDGLISGGVAENTVPEKCTFTADFRFNNEKERKEVQKIANEIAQTSFVEGTSCNLILASFRCAMYETKENIELYEKIKKIYSENNIDNIDMINSPGASDAADLTQMGITCLDGFGTEGGNIHGLGEFAYIKSLAQSAKRLASVAFCIE